MRRLVIATIIAALPWVASAAPTWQTISAEPGKRIELDRTSLKREGNVVQAQGRVVLEKELIDTRSGAGYRVIEAITRYDCTSRSANTLKRIYKKNEGEVIREEELRGAELPVRSGTLDDKVLREVCRPPKESATDIAQRANEAGSKLKEANDATLKKELTKAEAPATKRVSETVPAEKEAPALPSIRPNLKAVAQEAGKPVSAAAEPPKPTPPAASKPAPLPVAQPALPAAPSPSAAARPAVKTGTRKSGYMLELTGLAPAVEQHAHIHWSYEGDGAPANWARIDPKNTLCASGTRQSPIDLRDGLRVDLEPIRFDYRPTGFRIIDNGHTIQVTPGEGSITLTGKSYQLVQFHFHRPSEEKINGRAFDMVAHLVHKADDGQLAVVAVLLDRGQENPFIQTLWNYIPLEKNVSIEPPGLNINPHDLLPANRSYYTYMGSLTTPPCSEGVLWLVMKQPVELSQDQLAIFSRLYRHNARPTQPVNGRVIKESR